MGFLAHNPSSTGGGPTRKTSEDDLNQFNIKLRSQPWYQQFFAERGLDPNKVNLSRKDQGALQDLMAKNGMPLQGGMHIDNAGNLNQKNRTGRNIAIGAGIAAGGYFAAPYIAGALGAGGGGAGAGGAAASGAAGAGAGAGAAGAAIPTLASTAIGTGMGVAPSIAGASTIGGVVGGGAAAAGGAGATAAATKGVGLGSKLLGMGKSQVGQAALRGGGAIFSAMMAKRAQADAMKRSPEEMAALGGANRAGNQLSSTGTDLTQSGQGNLNQTSNYWGTLLGGSRASMAQATAGPRAAITDTYRGAERGLEKSGVRGAQRDVVKSELNRDRASKIAGLTTGVQPAAAEALTGIGSQRLQSGGPMLSQSGDIFSNLLGQGTANRQYGRQEGEKSGTGWGSMIFDMINGYGKKSA